MKSNTIFALIGGAIAGAVVALLFAPEKGAETRKKIKDAFDKEFEKFNKKTDNEQL